MESHLNEGLEISKKDSFERYLNKYGVICRDITCFISTTGDINYIVDDIQSSVISERKSEFPEYVPDNGESLSDIMTLIAIKTGRRFVVIIDECYKMFSCSRTYRNIQLTETEMWAESAEYIVDEYYREMERKGDGNEEGSSLFSGEISSSEGDLKGCVGNLPLVGINGDKDVKGVEAKRHGCVIERS